MNIFYHIYEGDEKLEGALVTKTMNSLVLDDAYGDKVFVLEDLNLENLANGIHFFQQAGVTNSPNYVKEVLKAVHQGANIGCAKWQYNVDTQLISKVTQFGCNFASKYQQTHHGNGFITSENGDFKFIENAHYNMPVPKDDANKRWLKQDLPNAFKTGYNFLKKL